MMDVILYIILGIILLLLISVVLISNKFNVLKVKIEEADSGIDVALTKRYDVLVKMIEVVKSYSKHEKDTIFEVIKLRKGMTLKDRNIVNEKMDKNVEKINMVIENYPELRSNENFKTLQQSIVEVEEHLQAARRLYNANVSLYNQMLVQFPYNIIAKLKKLEKKSFFETENKNDVHIVL